MSTHSPAEWAAFLSLGVGVHGAFSAPYFLFVNATRSDFDPRPAVRRALETGRLQPMWQAAIHTGHDLNRAIATSQRASHDAAVTAVITAAALLALLIPTAPEATR
jgi:hypothetical protein